jgi:hypothetical protein
MTFSTATFGTEDLRSGKVSTPQRKGSTTKGVGTNLNNTTGKIGTSTQKSRAGIVSDDQYNIHGTWS